MLLSFQVFSQRTLQRGIEALEKNHFHEAITHFNNQLDKRNNDSITIAKANYKIAYSYLRISLPETAEKYFKNALEYNYPKPIIHYHYAKSLQMLQKYNDAKNHFEKYKALVPDCKLADEGLKGIALSFEMLMQPTRYEVSIVRGINSPHADYSPFIEQRNAGTIYFTSSRPTELHNIENPESGDFNSNIYYSSIDRRGRWSAPQLITGSVNSEFEEGAAALNFRGREMYFTRCQYQKRNDRGCRIYLARKTGRFWGRVEKVNIPGIPETASIGHPAISHDELTLIFSAEGMPDNKGRSDLYFSVRERKRDDWSEPVNMGSHINTEGDEMYPYIRNNGDLYFASNGHPGMGGLDIFKATKKNDKYIIKNLGSPINSSHDDFGIVFMDNKDQGFMSSKRNRGLGKIDVFHFVLPDIEFSVSGTVYDMMTTERIEKVEINVFDEDQNLISKISTDNNGNYEVKLNNETKHIIIYNHKNYNKKEVIINTKELNDSKFFRRDIFLKE